MKCPRSPAAKAPDFDRLGTQLWNAAIRLKDQSSPLLKTWPQFESQLRVLAYFLLDTAQRSYVKHGSKKSSQNLIRILKTALRASRTCIAAEALDLCTMLFEKVAEHVEHIQNLPREYKKDKQESEAEESLKELTADYNLLRATLSWRQNKPDSVSFWLSRVLLLPDRSDMLHLAEKKADLTYEVGKSALQKKQFPSAARWLEQSHQIFDDIDPEILSSDLCDLRFVVMLDYARALVGVGDAVSLQKADSLVVTLDREHCFKIEVQLTRLDIFYARRPFEADKFCGVLNQIVRGAILSQGNFRSYEPQLKLLEHLALTEFRIMYQIQRLNTHDPEKTGATNITTIASSAPGPHSNLACQTLDVLLDRLLDQPSIVQVWIEKIVVIRIWICSISLHAQDHLPKLENLFEDIANSKCAKLGTDATHASQSVSSTTCHFIEKILLTFRQLIWKAVTALQQLNKQDEAARWIILANHDIFTSSGEINKAKLLR